VTIKVLSGDHPATVAALVRRVGVDPGTPVDAASLPTDSDDLADVVAATTVFGRVRPEQKQSMVAALQSRGHVVGMIGDGVNDVLALRDADVGIAMGAGSSASRAVAQLVLLDNSFASLPRVVAEGRRVIANVERVANLFVTKTVYATLLAISVGVARLPFPFLPRHLTLVSTLTIGVPGFVLALAPNARRALPGFVLRVLRFALPAGVVAAAATFLAYRLVRDEPGTRLVTARTVATVVLLSVALWVLSILVRMGDGRQRWLVPTMAGGFVVVMAVPSWRLFFAMDVPRPLLLLAAVGVAALSGLALEMGWQAAGWLRSRTDAGIRDDR
jgi:cation-transporting ATPase E